MAAVTRQVITIDKVVAGGKGLGRLADGLVVMVPFVLPGEKVAVALERPHRGYVPARLIDVIDPAPARVEPVCPHFFSCGGCHLQHAAYPAQLAIKAGILAELVRQAGIAVEAGGVEPVLASPHEFQYRQRIRLQVDSDGGVGFFARRSHEVIAIDECPLAVPPLNQVLAGLKRQKGFRTLGANAVALELLYNPLGERVVVMIHMRRKPRPADQALAESLAAPLDLVQSLWLVGEGFAACGPYGRHPAGSGEEAPDRIAFALSEHLAGRRIVMGFEAGGFCQVNLFQNERLIGQMLDWTEVGPDDAVLDLFCGMGNFSLPLALRAGTVLGSDLQRSSIRGAKANAAANRVTNCQFLRADAAATAEGLSNDGQRFHLVLLDPPRQGCREVLRYLPELCAKNILYISCDPATLVRDLKELQQLGFLVCHLRGVDMFPQTCHLEAIAMLRRG